MSKSGAGPWYRWFPRDFLASSRVQRMELDEQGAYRRLLDFQWMDGSIPAAMPEIGRLLGLRGRRLARVWAAVAPCFDPVAEQPDRLANARLAAEHAEAQAFTAERSEAGARGAAARWRGKPVAEASDSHGSADGSAMREPIANDGHAHAHAHAQHKQHPPDVGEAPVGAGAWGHQLEPQAAAAARPKRHKPPPSAEAVALAEWHAKAARHWKPNANVNPTSATSLTGFAKLLKRTTAERVRDVLTWHFRGLEGDYAPRNDFDWRPNLLSGASVERAWDKIESGFDAASRREMEGETNGRR